MELHTLITSIRPPRIALLWSNMDAKGAVWFIAAFECVLLVAGLGILIITPYDLVALPLVANRFLQFASFSWLLWLRSCKTDDLPRPNLRLGPSPSHSRDQRRVCGLTACSSVATAVSTLALALSAAGKPFFATSLQCSVCVLTLGPTYVKRVSDTRHHEGAASPQNWTHGSNLNTGAGMP